MTAFAFRLLTSLCKALSPKEREVFLGDVEELRLGSCSAIASVTGLIFRRQAEPWKQRRPWLVLIGLILPFGLLLAHATSIMADIDSVFLWMYASNWTPAFLSRGWLLAGLLPQAAGILFFWLVLACWSWTAGFVIALVSRVSSWITAGLVALVLLTATLFKSLTDGSAAATAFGSTGRPWSPDWFYSVVFPASLLLLLVLLPAVAGLRQGHSADALSARLRKSLYAAIGITAFSSLGAPVVAWLLRSIPYQFAPFRIATLTPLAFAAPITWWVAKRRSDALAPQTEGVVPTEA